MSHIDPTRQIVTDVIREFDWHNYGLDDVAFAEPDYAEALAVEVMDALAEHFAEPRSSRG